MLHCRPALDTFPPVVCLLCDTGLLSDLLLPVIGSRLIAVSLKLSGHDLLLLPQRCLLPLPRNGQIRLVSCHIHLEVAGILQLVVLRSLLQVLGIGVLRRHCPVRLGYHSDGIRHCLFLQ